MGLGKTIQVIAFLSAVLGKTGHPEEKNTRKALHRSGRLDPTKVFRALIICPTSVIYNWEREFDTWGYFSTGIYHGTSRKETLWKAANGLLEITITSFATARNYQHELDPIFWSCIIVDEVHQLKESTSQTTQAMKSFTNVKSHFGLTGTAIQNNYKDLWCILDFCNPGSVGLEPHFEKSISIPLKRGQAFDATKREIAEARRIAAKFRELVLKQFMLRRTKALIAHQLPKKEDKIVFCPMSSSQKVAYRNLLQSDDFQLLTRKDERCDCLEAQLNLSLTRGKCCYSRNSENVPIGHTILPALVTLQKVSNHIALIMPDQADPNDKRVKDKKLIKYAFPEVSDAEAPRMTWINMRNPEFCGKWKVLEKLLEIWKKLNSKVLLFSASVKLLNMLEILMSDKSYFYSRLDGKTPISDRLEIVDKFNNDPKQFVFLISTRAGGVGLNLTSANVVVIFDPNWNPSHDLQAQDRAFRIGQQRDVSVYRLIAAGSLEEVIYGRQVYKQQQAQIGYEASEERRLFSGVQGDKNKKGELFGLENLLTVYNDSDVITKLIIDKLEKAESKFLVQGRQVVVSGVEIVDMIPPQGIEEEDDALLEGEGETSSASKKRKTSDAADDETTEIMKAFKDCTEDERAVLAKRERDAVSAILTGHDIAYTHVNSEILGSSKAERLITKDAIHALETGQSTQEAVYGFAPEDDAGDEGAITEEVRKAVLMAMAAHQHMSVMEFAEFVLRSSREERELMLEKFRASLH
ncbi:P-loop containing nucleoside triphosphate hydrolase protein [Obelidium mucronatum]|nr:P-loop containing nucleoside triphosphate hydrolase protein [Obelidium mucronatum]